MAGGEGGGQGFCDSSTKVSVIKWRKMSKIA
jgi:hypothetical protein